MEIPRRKEKSRVQRSTQIERFYREKPNITPLQIKVEKKRKLEAIAY